VSVNPYRGDPHPRAAEQLDADPHLALVILVLKGIRDAEQRVAWIEANLPRTASMLGVATSWSAISALPSNGSGELPRRREPDPPPPSKPSRYPPKDCAICGATFTPFNSVQVTCSKSCRLVRNRITSRARWQAKGAARQRERWARMSPDERTTQYWIRRQRYAVERRRREATTGGDVKSTPTPVSKKTGWVFPALDPRP
jgi:predicted nucleic acid-binding Zn ribbon protein